MRGGFIVKKIINKTSVFPAEAGVIWERLQWLRSLRYVASPYASFHPVDKREDFTWQEGEAFAVHCRLLGILPLGVHTIQIIKLDRDNFTIYTNESNRYIPVWNHRITLRPVDEQNTEYTDRVEIDAGWKTPFVYAWAKCFYAHRQKKWLALLRA